MLELRDQRRRFAAAGIDHAVQRAEEVGVPPHDWCALVAALIATAQAQNVRRSDAGLRRASGLRLEAQRKAFVEQDRGKIAHDRATLRNAVQAVVPPIGRRSGPRKTWTEMQLILERVQQGEEICPCARPDCARGEGHAGDEALLHDVSVVTGEVPPPGQHWNSIYS